MMNFEEIKKYSENGRQYFGARIWGRDKNKYAEIYPKIEEMEALLKLQKKVLENSSGNLSALKSFNDMLRRVADNDTEVK